MSTLERHEIITQSPLMLEKIAFAERMAMTDSTVLLTGQRGVGKELFAHYIHEHSTRAQGPFIKIDCASIPEKLLEAELFGVAPGVLTDGISEGVGRFELAHGGSLFLDEIADIPLSLHRKILNALLEKKITAVASSERKAIDCRIIATTSKNIESLVEEGSFLADLYYRINLLVLKIPTLMRHREDIELLARHFLKQFTQIHHKAQLEFSSSALHRLNSHTWPGNVRELANIIERAVILCPSALIELSHLGLPSLDDEDANQATDLKTAIDNFKREFIYNSLVQNNFSQTKAASVLNIQRSYLARLIKELNIKNLH